MSFIELLFFDYYSLRVSIERRKSKEIGPFFEKSIEKKELFLIYLKLNIKKGIQ